MDININAIAAARVNQGSHTFQKNSGKWPFHGKSGNSRGIYQAPQGIFENSEISGNGNGRFKCCFCECYVYFPMFCPQFPGKTTGKINHWPIRQWLIYVTYDYPWWIGEWPAYTLRMVFIFTLWKSLCAMLCYGPNIYWCHLCVLNVL